MMLQTHSFQNRGRFICGLTVAAVAFSIACFASPAEAAPQDEHEAPILQYGPDLEMFKREGIELALKGWQWQVQLSQAQQKLIRQLQHDWQSRLEQALEKLNELQAQLGSVGLAYPLDYRTVHQIDDEIRVLQSEKVALTAQLNQIQSENARAISTLQMERAAKEGELQLLHAKLDALSTEYDRIKKLHDNGMVPERELGELKASIMEMELRIQNERNTLELFAAQLDNDKAAAMTSVVDQSNAIQRQLEELLKRKQQVAKLQPVQKMEDINVQAELARRMVEMAEIKLFELQLENTRNLALIELVEKRLADQAKDE